MLLKGSLPIAEPAVKAAASIERQIWLAFLCLLPPHMGGPQSDPQRYMDVNGAEKLLQRFCLQHTRFAQEAGLKVKEYELLRRNFADSGNFGELSAQLPVHCSKLC